MDNPFSVGLVTFEEFVGLAPRDTTTHIDIFQNAGVEECLLDCDAWGALLDTRSKRSATHEERRDKRKELERLKREGGARRGRGFANRPAFGFSDLEASAKAGCKSCAIIMGVLQGFISTRPLLSPASLTLKWSDYEFDLDITNNNDGVVFCLEWFSPTSENSPAITGMSRSNPLQGDTSSPMSLSWAQDWIADCERNHSMCGSTTDSKLPSRLLHLKTIEHEGIEGARLTLPVKGVTGRYACLSHCWGTKPMPLKTLVANIDDHLRFIPWAKFPKTFREAAQIATELGLEYLWIDSLCIIQDSKSDWDVESAQMAEIYSGAFVTIASVASSDFSGGCFSSHPAGKDTCLRITEGRCALGPDLFIGLREHPPPPTSQEQLRDLFPLLTRAWVYQERMLSKRLLYCTARELQIVCRESHGCECTGTSSLHRAEALRSYPSAKDKHKYSRHIFRTAPGVFSDLELSGYWHKVVTEFSRLRLTFAGDKFPALSGCVKDMARVNGGEYIAGLWRQSLVRDLLWEVPRTARSERPPEWRAPTWSWASIESDEGVVFASIAVSERRAAFIEKVKLLECRPKRQDATGELAPHSARMRLTSVLYRVPLRRVCRDDLKTRIRRRQKYVIETIDMTRSEDGQVLGDRCVFSDAGLPLWGGAVRISLRPDFVYGLDTFEWHGNKKSGFPCYHTSIYLLPICDSRPTENWGMYAKDGVDYFLALKRTGTQASGGSTYERVGLVTVTGKAAARERLFSEVLDRERQVPDHELTVE